MCPHQSSCVVGKLFIQYSTSYSWFNVEDVKHLEISGILTYEHSEIYIIIILLYNYYYIDVHVYIRGQRRH